MAELEESEAEHSEADESPSEHSLGESSGIELVPKKNTKALVWKYFGFEAHENRQPHSTETPKCRLCYHTIAAKDSNTTNLHNYLKHKHPEYSVV